ncbi:hypothetical protein [Methylobacterium sp. 285MFTsu5.1]|uniref:hypothetical protein n=1 Tax=Methylobacterium sp. 285MFTsu5.1 TaxID=1172187 RepID=UPI00036E1AF6|nr:hypothetical protein [Methylobacterium sp. 285MFTsu5.1]
MIELKPEHAAALAALLNSQAAQTRVQIASLMESAEAVEAVATKVSDGGRDLSETEIRLLADLVSGLEKLPDVFLGIERQTAKALFADLRVQLAAAKAKREH